MHKLTHTTVSAVESASLHTHSPTGFVCLLSLSLSLVSCCQTAEPAQDVAHVCVPVCPNVYLRASVSARLRVWVRKEMSESLGLNLHCSGHVFGRRRIPSTCTPPMPAACYIPAPLETLTDVCCVCLSPEVHLTSQSTTLIRAHAGAL